MTTELDIAQELIEAAAAKSRAAVLLIDFGSDEPDYDGVEDHFDYAAAAAAEAADDRRRAFEDDPLAAALAETIAAHAAVDAYYAEKKAGETKQPSLLDILNEADRARRSAVDIALAAKACFDAVHTAADAAIDAALNSVSEAHENYKPYYAAFQAADTAYDIAYHSERKEREERERQDR